MLINPHGVYKPSGMRRTYPHFLTQEGISASEAGWHKAYYDCALPFTRFAIGPGDYAPIASYHSFREDDAGRDEMLPENQQASLAALAAEAVLYESGLQCLADKPATYRASKAYEFYKDMPSEWDDSVLVGGEIGHYVNMARSSGNDWYMGIMCNVEPEGREETFALDFLKSGVDYTATIFKDGETQKDIVVETKSVKKGDTLTLKMLQYGGAAIKITKNATHETVKLLNDAVTSAGALIEAEYTAETWNVLQKRIQEAQAVLAKEGATQTDVDKAAAALDAARRALQKADPVIKEADKKALNAAIQSAEALKAADYTEESWKVLQTKLQEAKEVAGKAEATQEEVDKAASALTAAQTALKKAQQGGNQGTEITLKKITLNKTKLTLGVKETFKLKTKLTPSGYKAKKVTWKSSKPKTVKVKNGKVTALKKGSAKITVTVDGKKATCSVKVKAAPKKVNVAATTRQLKKGQSYKIKVKLPKNTASNKITYKSSNKKVAIVSANGKVKAKKKGTSTITVKTFNKKTAKIKITVR